MAVDLAERQGLTLDHARAWLRHVGLETPVDDVDGESAIIADARAVLTDGARRVASDVRASLDFHHTQSAGLPMVERVLLTGPAVAVPGFSEVLERELGLPVESRITPGAPDDARRAPQHRRRPGGRGGRSMKAVNLIPADQRRARPTPPARAAAPSTSCSAVWRSSWRWSPR